MSHRWGKSARDDAKKYRNDDVVEIIDKYKKGKLTSNSNARNSNNYNEDNTLFVIEFGKFIFEARIGVRLLKFLIACLNNF